MLQVGTKKEVLGNHFIGGDVDLRKLAKTADVQDSGALAKRSPEKADVGGSIPHQSLPSCGGFDVFPKLFIFNKS
jgi:hypothetical protein